MALQIQELEEEIDYQEDANGKRLVGIYEQLEELGGSMAEVRASIK